jgi:rubredoxin
MAQWECTVCGWIYDDGEEIPFEEQPTTICAPRAGYLSPSLKSFDSGALSTCYSKKRLCRSVLFLPIIRSMLQ